MPSLNWLKQSWDTGTTWEVCEQNRCQNWKEVKGTPKEQRILPLALLWCGNVNGYIFWPGICMQMYVNLMQIVSPAFLMPSVVRSIIQLSRRNQWILAGEAEAFGYGWRSSSFSSSSTLMTEAEWITLWIRPCANWKSSVKRIRGDMFLCIEMKWIDAFCWGFQTTRRLL